MLRNRPEDVDDVVRVDRREDEVAGERGLHGDVRGLLVADLAHHDLVGSWRRIERSPRAKVNPFFSLTGICVMPGSWYSTGSSIVMILSSSLRISESAP
jgi:hypothetical protein